LNLINETIATDSSDSEGPELKGGKEQPKDGSSILDGKAFQGTGSGAREMLITEKDGIKDGTKYGTKHETKHETKRNKRRNKRRNEKME